MLIKLSKYLDIFVKTILIVILSILLTGCISSLYTGASLIYDRHNIYIKLNDFQLSGMVNARLYRDKLFKCQQCSIEVAVFNRDILLVGSVPNAMLRQEAVNRVNSIPGKRRFFNQIQLYSPSEDTITDSFITGSLRSQILADSTIDPHKFKIVTFDGIVYIMGDVSPKQARTVIMFARQQRGVKRVVKLLRYYRFSNKGP